MVNFMFIETRHDKVECKARRSSTLITSGFNKHIILGKGWVKGARKPYNRFSRTI